MKKLVGIGLISLILCGATYSLLWGRLAPISPLIVGFEHKESPKAVIYYHKGTSLSKLEIIDSIVERVEEWHQLTFKKKPQIFICSSDKEYRRITGSKARFIVFAVYGRLYVSDRAIQDADRGSIHLEVYLAHELSHSLLYQNMSSWHSLSYPGWLLEGIAVRSSNQMGVDGYFTKELVCDTIKKGHFISPDDWGTIITRQKRSIRDLPLENRMWFIYAEFGCIVDDLLRAYGKDKFLQFLKATLTERDYKKAFKNVFHMEYEKFLESLKDDPGWPLSQLSGPIIRPSELRPSPVVRILLS